MAEDNVGENVGPSASVVGVIITPPHWYYRPAHLEEVIEQMRVLGPPVLRACWDADAGGWYAQEGTHRLRAAKALGLVPVLVPMPWRRSGKARVRAMFRAAVIGHAFERVIVQGEPGE